ncbi:hypothetical protein [Muriicola sp.]|uniref:hypothetical protein n=1 Tax=Muriicola sp. TaxID=2020856 RepID=UPI003C74F46D
MASTESKTQKIVEDELRGIDWNEVDQYPLFEGCDETAAKQAQRQCFENTLLQNLGMTLQDFHFIIEDDIETTIYIDFLVDNKGEITVVTIDKNADIEDQLPEFNGIITKGLKSMPVPAPALKRGVPVKTRFRLPLQITTK